MTARTWQRALERAANAALLLAAGLVLVGGMAAAGVLVNTIFLSPPALHGQAQPTPTPTPTPSPTPQAPAGAASESVRISGLPSKLSCQSVR